MSAPTLPYERSGLLDGQVDRLRFAASHQRRGALALAVARGETGLAAELLGGWRFAQVPALMELVLARAAAVAAAPTQPELSWALGPPQTDPQMLVGTPLDWWVGAGKDVAPGAAVADTPEHRHAWVLAVLGWMGTQVEQRLRQGWVRRRQAHPEHTERDGLAAMWWAGCAAGAPQLPGQAEQDLLWRPAARSVQAALMQVGWPQDQVQELAQGAMADLWMRLFDPQAAAGGTPGWKELAAWLLTGCGMGPVDALSGGLGPAEARRAAACFRGFGHWGRTAMLLSDQVPDLDPAQALLDRWRADPAVAATLVDLHLGLRLLGALAEPGPHDPLALWALMARNEQRSVGRLRALLAVDSRDVLLDAVLAQGALWAATTHAVRRYVRVWVLGQQRNLRRAWRSAAPMLGAQAPQPPLRLALDPGVPASPPCADHRPQALGTDELPALDAWLLLVLLRGERTRLEDWVQGEGGLSRQATQALKGVQDGATCAARGPRVFKGDLRAYLRVHLGAHLAGLGPSLCRVAALDPVPRGFAGRLRAVLPARMAEVHQYQRAVGVDVVAAAQGCLDALGLRP